MEKRTFLAIGLCVAIFILWHMVVAPRIRPPQPPPPAQKPAPAAPAPAAQAAPAPAPPQAEAPVPDYPEEPLVTFETRRFRVVFTNKGAGIESLALKYPRETDAVPLLAPRRAGWPHLALRQVEGKDPIESRPWKIHERGPDSIEFRLLLREGVEISKKFVLDPEKHLVRMVVFLENKNPAPPDGKEPPEKTLQFEVLAFNGLEIDSPYRYEQYLRGLAFTGKGIQTRDLAGVEKGEAKLWEAGRLSDEKERNDGIKNAESYLSVRENGLAWVGLGTRFFAALLIPSDGKLAESGWFRPRSPETRKAADGLKNLNASLRMEKIPVGARAVPLEFTAYLGPIQADALKEAPGKAGDIIDYGSGCFIFGPLIRLVAPVILGVLNFFSSILHNYGVGIILTTLLIRVCMFPLSKKSQVSAFRMQGLAPKIQILRERYKDDPQKLQQEQMRLFREHGINPLSGCLPMFLQLPIFVGMYSVFERSLELRQAPFVLWMKDLSQPDMLIGPWAPVEIPLIITSFSIDAFNLLPIVMTITWFLQSYYAPRSPDPQAQMQQKMMLWMPAVFGLMCYGLASGLSLYFLVNSLLGMAEQKLIKKYFLKPPA